MMLKNIILIFVFTLVFSVLGQYVGGGVYFKLTHIPFEFISFDSLYLAFIEYRYDDLIKKYVFIGCGVAGVISVTPILMSLFVLVMSIKKEEIHGSAKFATNLELKNSGLFDKEGNWPILVGKMSKGMHKNKFVRLYGQLFLGVSAPTRSGKGVGIVIPNLVTYPDSVVTVDIKFENFIKTAGYRKNQGQEVYLFAPMGFFECSGDIEKEKVRSHRWNCFDYVRRSSAFRVSDLLLIASSLYPAGSGKDSIWNNLASKLFTGLCLWMLDTEKHTYKSPTLPYVLKLTAIEGGLEKWMKEEISKDYLSNECLLEFNNFISAPSETKGSILSNLVSPLAIFGDQVVAESISSSDFDLRDLRKKRMSVYIGIPPPKLGVLSKLLNLFFEQLINENTMVLPEHDPSLKYQCLLMLDEFTSLGRIKQIETSIGFAAGYNLRFVFIYQDKSQLEKNDLYGKEGAETIESNQGAKVIFPPKEVNSTVENLSKTLGTKTVKIKSKSITYGKHHSRSISNPLQKRQLMMPHEIVELGNITHKTAPIGLKVFFIKDNLMPFVMDKIIYFDEPILLERTQFSEKNIPTIPLLPSFI